MENGRTWQPSVSTDASRLPALDLLRFLAAAGVMLYHFVTCYPDDQPAISALTRYGYLGGS
jgi:peptidoglycan/LPS O-acetylase OafA/YrhL